MTNIIVLVHNIRSAFNVGSILRTAEGFGVSRINFSGYSPYPLLDNDGRLPHIRQKQSKDIAKTALGAEKALRMEYRPLPPISELRRQGYVLTGLEQAPGAISLPEYRPPAKTALLLGEEVGGIAPRLLAQCDVLLEIPMRGAKESFNVSVAAGIALYHLTLSRT